MSELNRSSVSASFRCENVADNEPCAFVAFIDNARSLHMLLKAIHFKEHATVCASADGLKVTVEDVKCVQANAFVQSKLFQEFVIQEETVIFKINLTVLLECLNIFGMHTNPSLATSLKMSYESHGSPLKLFLEEGGILTDCSLRTMEYEDILDFDFTPARVLNKIVMKSDILKEAWSELDTNSDVLQLLLSPDPPYFELSTEGALGTIRVNFNKDSDMIESFACSQPQTNRYQMQLIKPSNKALTLSCKISIRTDERGFLCLQYMIKPEEGQVCFVEYICAPNEEENS